GRTAAVRPRRQRRRPAAVLADRLLPVHAARPPGRLTQDGEQGPLPGPHPLAALQPPAGRHQADLPDRVREGPVPAGQRQTGRRDRPAAQARSQPGPQAVAARSHRNTTAAGTRSGGRAIGRARYSAERLSSVTQHSLSSGYGSTYHGPHERAPRTYH